MILKDNNNMAMVQVLVATPRYTIPYYNMLKLLYNIIILCFALGLLW